MALQHDVLVIGAGLSGLMAARVLGGAGHAVHLLDKGRSVGGRMATRRVGDGKADTGAQFFTVRDAEFEAYVKEWMSQGIVFEWSRGWSDGSLNPNRDGHPRYAVRDGMNALAKHLSGGLDVQVHIEVEAVRRADAGWHLTDKAGNTYTSPALVMTPPVPQTLKLLDNGGVSLPADARAMLESVAYEPCLVIIAEVDGNAGLPAPGAMQRHNSNLYWIADNQRKGISKTHLLTIQCSGPFSRALWDLHDEEVIRKVRVDLMPVMGSDSFEIVAAQVKRWRYSRPTSDLQADYLLADVADASGATAPVLFAGDAWCGARVEGAFISGLRGGRALAEKLASS
jgi:renalase